MDAMFGDQFQMMEELPYYSSNERLDAGNIFCD
jgi:hypothetical protein